MDLSLHACKGIKSTSSNAYILCLHMPGEKDICMDEWTYFEKNLQEGYAGDPEHSIGVLETMLACNTLPTLIDYHWERLDNSIQQLSLPKPNNFHKHSFYQMIEDCLQQLPVYPMYKLRLLYYLDQNIPKIIIRCQQWIDNSESRLVCGIIPGIKKEIHTWSHIKSSKRALYSQATAIAKAKGWQDGILLNQFNRPIESTIANLVIEKQGKLYTPPLSEGCIGGVMRQYLCRQGKLFEKPITMEALQSADA